MERGPTIARNRYYIFTDPRPGPSTVYMLEAVGSGSLVVFLANQTRNPRAFVAKMFQEATAAEALKVTVCIPAVESLC